MEETRDSMILTRIFYSDNYGRNKGYSDSYLGRSKKIDKNKGIECQ
jgi:hypothetical protein